VPLTSTSLVPVEEVHQRAGQQQEVWQHAEKVGAVLGDQEECHDRQEAEQHQR
jgi:hypothetical protein